jgi:sorbitol/mannitol transport system substrate-binding protein
MKTLAASLLGATALVATQALAETTITIATVNNNDMIIMQKLSKDFEQKNPDIKLDWVVLEENVLRQKITTDIATKGRSVRYHDDRDVRGPFVGRKRLAVRLQQCACGL